MFTLREYQQQAVDGVECHKKNMIYLATGSGKSVIFKQLALNSLKKGEKVLFLVKRQQVLSQAVNKHFLTIHNDVSMMMGANKFRFADILCCSMDTLYRRQHLYQDILNKYKTIIIDECHDATADNYQSFISKITDQTTIGLTATPFLIGKKTHHFWDKVIHPVSTLDLIKQGHLVWPEVWMSGHTMQTKGVKTTAGDYNQKQLFNANDNSVVYGSIVDEYKKHALGKRCFCFCINVEHSKKIAEEYNKAGITAVHADADTPLDEREQILKDFAAGKIKVICNINIFSTGTDVPETEVGQMARPTKSLVLWIQQVGRILRPYPGKKSALILDHTDNTMNLGHPAINDFVAETSIEKVKENEDKKIPLYQCKSCFYVFGEKTDVCPMCGAQNEVKIRKIKEQKEAELKKFNLEQQKKDCPYEKFKKRHFIETNDPELKEVIKDRNLFWSQAKSRGWKVNAVFFKLHEKYPDKAGLVLKIPPWFYKVINEQQVQESSKPISQIHSGVAKTIPFT